ncbi:tRNA(Ile)-lysidine synthase [Luminiphilus syltensis NOR5-1B]|uniref:tRNA(Ile)-lysidine synthetase n=1 Tax=Luminiphilus syltensis NOR5-1B TaxID=565045 RepID=B8KSZ3_9GAMM|nr:tRNA(Ile)-lysidine synthase [Luminiphilus syltensis NOR5-1B]
MTLGDESSAIEVRAREARYRAFDDAVGQGEALFQAHHLDDQVETVLYRLLRGSGPRGLRGIPAERSLTRGKVVRPLLDIGRLELLNFCRDARLSFVQDPSNDDFRFDRNYLRHAVLPVIEQRWPGYRATLSRAAATQNLMVTWLEEEGLHIEVGLMGDPGISFDRTDSDPQRLATRLHHWLATEGLSVPDQRRLVEFARQAMFARADRQPRLALGPTVLESWRGVIYWHASSVDIALPRQLVAGQIVKTPVGRLEWRSDPLGIPAGTRLSTRLPGPGERVRVPGGRRRSIRKLLQERAVPPWWRDQLPLIEWEGNPVALLPVGLLSSAKPDIEALSTDPLAPVWVPDSMRQLGGRVVD